MELPVQLQEPLPDDPPPPSCDLVVVGVSAVDDLVVDLVVVGVSAVDDLVVDLVVVGAFVTIGPAPSKIPLSIKVTYEHIQELFRLTLSQSLNFLSDMLRF